MASRVERPFDKWTREELIPGCLEYSVEQFVNNTSVNDVKYLSSYKYLKFFYDSSSASTLQVQLLDQN